MLSLSQVRPYTQTGRKEGRQRREQIDSDSKEMNSGTLLNLSSVLPKTKKEILINVNYKKITF